jgi:hypothetical protein
MLKYLGGCVAALAGLMMFTPSNVAAAFRAVSMGVQEYAHAFEPTSSYALSINDYGQVISISEESYVQDWTLGTLWQPTSANATTGTFHSIYDVFGVTPPNRRGPTFNYLTEGGHLVDNRSRVFTPSAPNSRVGTVSLVADSDRSFRLDRAGYYYELSGGRLDRIDSAGNRQAYATTTLGVNASIQGTNTRGQVLIGNADNPLKFELYTPPAAGQSGGSTLPLPMSFIRGVGPTAYLNEKGTVITSLSWLEVGYQKTSAYLFDPVDGQVVSLDELLGVPHVDVLDLNDRDQILASFYEDDARRLGNYLLTPDGQGGYSRLRIDTLPVQRIDANTLVGNYTMTSMNNHDQLVGAASWSFDNGVTWRRISTMLVVPEPTALLAAAPALLLALRRRR